jgi:hypothetical protein
MDTLFTVTLLELFIGGGGRLLEVGPITVRMILFAVCLCVGLIVAIYRIQKGNGVSLAIILVTAYLVVHVSALWIGFYKGNDLNVMMVEMQQSLYWLVAPFFALALSRHKMVLRAASIIRIAGLFLAVVYIGVVFALMIGAINYFTLYEILSDSGEFAFRSESFFFYKGFLYLGIATIFFIAQPNRFSSIYVSILIIALIMTLTRGFVVSTAIAVILVLMMQRRFRQLSIALAVVMCAAFILWIYIPAQNDKIEVSRAISNLQRIDDYAYIVDKIKISTLFIGEGLGTMVNGRINIENTFFWALWRLGFAGVLFWLLPLVMSFYFFSKICRKNSQYNLACAYFFSVILVYVQTLTNPYLNNPIGLSFVIVAIFSLRTLSKIVPDACQILDKSSSVLAMSSSFVTD